MINTIAEASFNLVSISLYGKCKTFEGEFSLFRNNYRQLFVKLFSKRAVVR
jgi:hypothetical protein